MSFIPAGPREGKLWPGCYSYLWSKPSNAETNLDGPQQVGWLWALCLSSKSRSFVQALRVSQPILCTCRQSFTHEHHHVTSHSAAPFSKSHSACMVQMAVEVRARPCDQDSGHMGTESRQVARHMMDLVELGFVVLQCRQEGPLASRKTGKLGGGAVGTGNILRPGS